MLLDVSREYRYVNATLAFLLLSALAAPALVGAAPFPACPYAELGRTCPTCGLTRSVLALYGGDLAGSLRHHAGGVVLAAATWVELCLRGVPCMVRWRWLPWADLAQMLVVIMWIGTSVFRSIW